jgi:4-amino-4-deoxy-L-arabinose transferase-like glycosyltransferase
MSERGRAAGRRGQAFVSFLMLVITATGFWLRWLYVRDVPLFVDEYLTLHAARRILSEGLPLLASGNFYSHGLLLSYVEAVVVGIGGTDMWLTRLPVLVMSTATIPLIYWFGRRAFSASAGVISAALLAFAPEAILWGGRVRMYAPLQFFVLLTTIVFYLWVVLEEDRLAYSILFVLCYWGALFSHAEAMILLPIWGLWALVQRGWRWCLRPAGVVAFGLAGLSAVVEILLRRIGPPVQTRVAAGVYEPTTRQYVEAALDTLGVQRMVESLFLAPMRLPVTLLVLAGLGYLLWMWVRKLGDSGAAERRALAYLYALLLPVLALLLFGLSPSWKSPRYAFMLLPQLFLIAGAVLARFGRWLQIRTGDRWAWLTLLAVVALIAVGSWPSAMAATQESVPAYDWAFDYVRDNQQAGDEVITFLCPAAFLHLGRCDYLAIPTDYSGFAFQKGGRWVSGWDAVPILDSASGLKKVLAEAPRGWFLVDEGRFSHRYDAEFLQAVWDEMELVAADQEMLVFRSAGEGRPKAGRFNAHRVDFEDGVSLVGYDLDAEALLPGGDLLLTLHWQARVPVGGRYTAYVHLVDAEGRLRTQLDAEPLDGLYPTDRWRPGPVLPDPHLLPLPEDLQPGRYRLEVGLYDTRSYERLPVLTGDAVLDYLWVGDPPPTTTPPQSAEAVFGDVLQLVGYDLQPDLSTSLEPGAGLVLTLYWRAIGQVPRDYTVYVHLVDEEGEIWGQADGLPLAGAYPTSHWDPGEHLMDTHELAVGAEAPRGTYHLRVGLYTLDDGQRLPVTGGLATGADGVDLASVTVR